MPSNPEFPPSSDSPEPGIMPPILPGSPPPLIETGPPSFTANIKSPTPETNSTPKTSPGRQLIGVLLNLCLGLFLVDAAVSLLDETLGLFLGVHLLMGLRGLVSLFALLMGFFIYAL